MKKMLLLLLMIVFNYQSALSQEEVCSFFNNLIINENVKKILDERECLVYSNTKYLYIIAKSENNSIFHEYFFEIISEYEVKLQTSNAIENKKLEIFFMKELYNEGFIDLKSSFYQGKDVREAGLPSFLSLFLVNNNRYFEYFLPAAINIFPYDKNIRVLLNQRFVKYISLNSIG